MSAMPAGAMEGLPFWMLLVPLALLILAGRTWARRRTPVSLLALALAVTLAVLCLLGFLGRGFPVVPLALAVLFVLGLSTAARFAGPGEGRAIPRSELAVLGTTIRRADELAGEGRVEEGYQSLLAGFRRAEEARRAGSPWARELARRWQEVAEEYAREYRVGSASEIAPAPAPPAGAPAGAPVRGSGRGTEVGASPRRIRRAA